MMVSPPGDVSGSGDGGDRKKCGDGGNILSGREKGMGASPAEKQPPPLSPPEARRATSAADAGSSTSPFPSSPSPAASPLLQWALAQVLGNVVFYLLCFILYLNFMLFKDYLWTILWSFLIGTALQTTKQGVLDILSAASNPQRSDGILSVLGEKISSSLAERRRQGLSLPSVAFEFVLDNGISLFALVGALSLLTHVVPHWVLWSCCLGAVLTLALFLYVTDRRVVFFYRRFIGDEELASLFSISLFVLSVGFIIVFLGTESILEGVSAAARLSRWVQTQLEDQDNKQDWDRALSKISGIASDTMEHLQLSDTFKDSPWWPAVNATVSAYLESNTALLQMDENDVILGQNFSLPDFSKYIGGGGGDSPEEGGAYELDLEAIFLGVKDHVLGFFSGADFDAETVWGAVGYAGIGGKLLAATSLQTLQLFVGAMAFVLGFGFKSLLFFVGTFYMTSGGDFFQTAIIDLLPIPHESKALMWEELRRGVESVLFLPFKIACFHGIVTLGTFTLLGMEFPFFATFLCVLVSVLPVVPAWLVCVPWAMLHCSRGDWVMGIILLLSQYLLLSILDNELLRKGLKGVSPFLTGLSLFLGFAVFGTQGVLLGPLIICMATFLHSFLGYMESTTSTNAQLSPMLSPMLQERGMTKSLASSEPSIVAAKAALATKSHRNEGVEEFYPWGRATRADSMPMVGSRSSSGAYHSPGAQSRRLSKRGSWGAGTGHSPGRLSGILQRMIMGEATFGAHQMPAMAMGGSVSFPYSSTLGPRGGYYQGKGGEIRVKLRVRQEDSQTERESATALEKSSRAWRMQVSNSASWDEFLKNAARITGVQEGKITGVFSVDGEQIKDVRCIDDGEILYLSLLRE